MPVSPSKERPLHPKREQTWHPSNLASATRPTASTSTTPENVVMLEGASMSSVAVAPPLSPLYSAPSPAIFVDCMDSAWSMPPASPIQR